MSVADEWLLIYLCLHFITPLQSVWQPLVLFLSVITAEDNEREGKNINVTQVLPHHQGKQHVLPFTLLSYVTLATQFGGRL